MPSLSDVAALIQEEFQRQILVESGKSGSGQSAKTNTDLWDSLWNPVDPAVNAIDKPDVNQTFKEASGKADNPVFCLACDAIFCSRLALEQHECPFVSFICPCGVSFGKYPEMWSHSKSHNHKATYVVNHITAMQKRVTFAKERESKLKFLEATAKNVGVVQNIATPAPPPPVSRYHTGQTVKLWRRFKPVVKLETRKKFQHQKKYICAICHRGMCQLDMLIEHVAIVHSSACVYGCRRCGLVLIGRIPPKPHHRCGSFYSRLDERFTIGQVLRDPLTAEKLFMPHACPYCTLKFGHAVHLSNHVRFNHISLAKQEEAPTVKAPLSRTKEAEHTLAITPHSASHTEKPRCALCGKRNDSVRMLGEHRCMRKLTLIKSETTTSLISEKAPQKLDVAETSGSEVTFRFQDVGNNKTHDHTKLLTMKTEPVEVNLKMTQDFSHRMCVKAEPDLHNDSDGAEKASADMNGLFYQKCSVPNANNLKYLLSSI